MAGTDAESAWRSPVFVGLGANLAGRHGPPTATLAAALEALGSPDTRVLRRSSWFRSAPVPASDQPWFVNGVAEIATRLGPDALLERLNAIEDAFGRTRGEPNAARVLDLDLLDYAGLVSGPAARAVLPHPRMHLRAFVLLPLAELAPDWRHPATGRPISALIAALPADQPCEPLVGEG